MKIRIISAIIFVLLLAVAGAIYYFSKPTRNASPINAGGSAAKSTDLNINQPKNMKITSPAFEENANIPAKFTCDGENINPPLALSAVPPEAKSLALILDDPDAPVAGGFVHWVIFNFDPKTAAIAENSVPADGTQGKNGAGQPRYTGPCPPSGTHRYFFKIFALDSELSLDSSATREDVLQAMAGHILDQAELIGLYKRP